jgi:hypothetical protein
MAIDVLAQNNGEKEYIMQHHLPNRADNTDLHANFLNERITTTSRFHRILEKVHPNAIEQLDYRRERQVYLLTNGQRTISQIASLLDIHPIDVAHMMKQLFDKGYVELLPDADAI